MITLNPQYAPLEIKSFLGGDLYYGSKIKPEQCEDFRQKINNYLPKLDLNQNEDYLVANALNPLLQSLGFTTAIKQKSQGRSEIDLIITQENNVAVIFEAKKPQNAEMISADNPNKTALHEAILYYLREKERAILQGKRFELKYIIITDFYEFFFFKESEFERVFYKDEFIKSLYSRYKSLIKSDLAHDSKRNIDFYDELKAYFGAESFSTNLMPLHLNLQNIANATDSSDFKPFIKAFAPDFLLDRYIHKDEINEAFYKELLYILGLKTIESGKDRNKIIPNNVSGTLYHNIADSLPNDADKTQENIISLIIVWLNRILFLKLIEANLVRFSTNRIDKNANKFLTTANIKDFQSLEHLFFEVFAKSHDKRDKDSPFFALPYLNSSLFSPSQIEQNLIHIRALSNDKELLSYKSQTKINLLRYLLDFLNSYDFGSGEEYEADTLINASILGNVFERINAYKEGSFYTPNAITSYMCEVGLQKIVVQKFNERFAWDCANLTDLRIQVDRNFNKHKDDFLQILREVKICDPAVGSGHFLVSALNAMIGIYDALGLIENIASGNVSIIGDEIIVRDRLGLIFTYQKPRVNSENHKIQVAIFNLKKSIIENNLFGVDINPNSVEICKLRLWIELLKNSYYLVDSAEGFDANLSDKIHQMQTLPNIDINIKCGNSLLSRFSLNDSLPTTQNIKNQISEYKKLVFDYKNADSAILKPNKNDIEKKIDNLKATFRLTLKDSKTKKELEKAIKNHTALYGLVALEGESLFVGLDCGISNSFAGVNLSENEKRAAFASAANINFLRDKLDSNGNGNAFEWRFEFPEVLNENGDFMGFDLVIGNPPYGVDLSAEDRQKYKSIYNLISTNTAQLFILLADKIASQNGINTFIVPKSLVYVAQWKPLRDFLQPNLFLLTDCGKAWSYVLLEMVIYAVHKNHKYESYTNTFLPPLNQPVNERDLGVIVDKKLIDLFGLFVNGLSQKEIDLGVKIRNTGEMMGKYCKNIGGSSYQNKLKKRGKHAFIGGKEIGRYGIKSFKGFCNDISKLPNCARIVPNSILVQDIVAHIQNPKPHIKIIATLPDSQKVFLLNTINQLVFTELDSRFAWALFNSTLINWYVYKFIFSNSIRTMHLNTTATDKIPLPKLTAKNQKITNEIINLVDKILALKAQGKEISAFESKIDDLIYKLYALHSHEIQIVESK
ncbi:type IIG restriction enzyme/methyltransferase [Helicobacter sp. 23-1045]